MQKWNDPRLRFEVPSKLANENPDLVYLNGLKIVNQIWIPDIFFIKHGEFKFSTDKHDPILIALKIYPNGTIYYIVRRNMVLTCEGNLKIFPFDSPKCFFSIESCMCTLKSDFSFIFIIPSQLTHPSNARKRSSAIVLG